LRTKGAALWIPAAFEKAGEALTFWIKHFFFLLTETIPHKDRRAQQGILGGGKSPPYI